MDDQQWEEASARFADRLNEGHGFSLSVRVELTDDKRGWRAEAVLDDGIVLARAEASAASSAVAGAAEAAAQELSRFDWAARFRRVAKRLDTSSPN